MVLCEKDTIFNCDRSIVVGLLYFSRQKYRSGTSLGMSVRNKLQYIASGSLSSNSNSKMSRANTYKVNMKQVKLMLLRMTQRIYNMRLNILICFNKFNKVFNCKARLQIFPKLYACQDYYSYVILVHVNVFSRHCYSNTQA